jgi:hypothetical protein
VDDDSSLDAAPDLQAARRSLVVIHRGAASFDVALDLEATRHSLVVINRGAASLHVRFDFHKYLLLFVWLLINSRMEAFSILGSGGSFFRPQPVMRNLAADSIRAAEIFLTCADGLNPASGSWWDSGASPV